MSRLFLAVLPLVFVPLLAVPTAANADKTKRLSQVERDHYYALRVYMPEKQQKTWLKLKTEAERNEGLKLLKLWDRFYHHNEDMRGDIIAGNVDVGWEEGAVYMAWGKPARKRAIAGRQAELSEEFQYRFEVDVYGKVRVWESKSKTVHKAAVLYEVQVTIDDGRVRRMVRKDCIPNWNFCKTIKWQRGE
jgi:hypothetical protein